MKVIVNINADERKKLVAAIGEIMGVAPVYSGAGGNVINGERYRFSYVVMNVTVGQNGEIVWDERTDNDTMKNVFDGLTERGYTLDCSELEIIDDAVEINHLEISDDRDKIAIELPFENGYVDFTAKKDNLTKLIESKATVIKAAIGEDGLGNLPVEFTEDGTVKFEWFKLRQTDIEEWRGILDAWSAFLAAAVKFSKKVQRITAKDSGELGDNPKFDFRVFLVKIGLTGNEHKAARKILLRNLDGSCAFKTNESEKRWKAKHTKSGGEVNENAE